MALTAVMPRGLQQKAVPHGFPRPSAIGRAGLQTNKWPAQPQHRNRVEAAYRRATCSRSVGG